MFRFPNNFSFLSLQISEGLSFLHSGVKMVHGNLCPENIILNKSGAWKIMGFDFSISSNNPSDAEVCFQPAWLIAVTKLYQNNILQLFDVLL